MNKFIRFAVSAVIFAGVYSLGYADARRRFTARPEIGGGDNGGDEPVDKSAQRAGDDRATALYSAGEKAVLQEFSMAWAELMIRGDSMDHRDEYVGPTHWFEPLVHKYTHDEAAAGLDQFGRKYLIGRDLTGATTVFFEREAVDGVADPRICYQTMHRSRVAVEDPTDSVATMRLWRAAQ